MARIDTFLQALAKHAASACILTSDENVTMRFSTGDRFTSQRTAHDALMALVREILPRGAVLEERGKTRFPYRFEERVFHVMVATSEGSWTVTLEPAPEAVVVERSAAPTDPLMPAPLVPSAAPAATSARAAAVTPVQTLAPVTSRTSAPAPSAPSPAAPPSPPEPRAPAPDRAAVAVAPGTTAIDRILRRMYELGASDLHLTTGARPSVRLHGEIRALEGVEVLGAADLLAMLAEIAPARNREEFEERSDTDFAHSIPGVSRFRVNFFRDRRGPGAVMRVIPFTILTPEQIGLPAKVLEICFLTKGLVLVTGPTGSGKSTTLATLVDHVNQNRADHIVTIEDPIEFVHEDKRCLVHQREVHTHTRSFKDALRAALREDPDIVLVGEMRDLETIAIAVETAETGHLVFGTLHTTTAPGTVDRIIDQFPPDRQEQIRQMVSESLRAVISQTLCRKIGGGRVAAYEILLGSGAVSNLIRERKTFQLFSVMQTSRNQGMVTLNDSLIALVKKGLVEPREAYMKSVNKGEFKGLLQREGLGTGIGE